MKTKKALVRKSAFLRASINPQVLPIISLRIAYIKISQEVVALILKM